MPEFTGSRRETFTVDAPFEAAKAHFGDRDRIIEAYPSLERAEKKGDDDVHFVIQSRNAMGASFQGNYRVRYTWTADDRLEWRDVGGNMKARGSIFFRPRGDRTELVYEQTMVIDIPLNRFVAKAVKPIVAKSIEGGIVEYLDSMRRSLARR